MKAFLRLLSKSNYTFTRKVFETLHVLSEERKGHGGMINVMSTIVGPLPPKCIDEDDGKVTRTPGVSGILKTAPAIKPQLMTPL